MQTSKSILLLSFCFVALLLLSLSLGSVYIPFLEVLKALSFQTLDNETWQYIIQNYRLPKTITSILVGGALSLCGLLMQTLFRNPLAGPYVLGLSSGASLGVALVVLGSSSLGFVLSAEISERWVIVLASSLGSFLVMLSILATAKRLKDTMALLIVGLMFSSITSAIVNVLSFFSSSDELQKYIFWSLGSLGNLSWSEIGLLSICCGLGILLSIILIKPLNALLMGEHYATSLGINIKQTRLLVITATCLVAGAITAFTGPIAFIGLAVPHLTRQLVKTTNHIILVPSVVLFGASLLLLCDSIAQLPFSELSLPINAVTSIIGAPVVIWLLVKQKYIRF
ncbi:iron complex transport system permease protein [Psychroflexus salarius]|uniref:Iron complex transport system permease protein n=1 Tax=Psychroflexus salarius TaxID=1155689 RepID=A0A1M4XB39_9FLAO|nr:iron ABC transporter permease [Psychroflexus salarius]SHE90749.1 iron complex transport system permease protein [Psychroflexus salarius]